MTEITEKKNAIKRQRELKQHREESASDGKYSNRFNPKNANTYYHPDHDRVFTVSSDIKVVNGEVFFKMAEFPRTDIFVIDGAEYIIEYMRDGMITLRSQSGKRFSGHYIKH